MSLPNSEREVLLSTALDGALSGQEQIEFDRAIATDTALASEFAELQALRADLRLSLADLRNQKLPAGASNRILAAIAAAAHQPMPVKVAANEGEPSGRFGSGRFGRTTWIATALALAASLMIAVTVWNRSENNAVTDPNVIAINHVDQAIAQPTPENVSPKIATEPTIPVANDSTEMIAANDSLKPDSHPKVMGIKPTAEATPSPEAIAMLSMPAVVAPSPAPPIAPQVNSIKRESLRAVLVLAIELTPAGRERLALQEALRATSIRLGQDSVMGAGVVAHLQTANVIEGTTDLQGAASKLFFIEASAKSIDRFVTLIMSDKEAFESVGLNIATEPPLLAAVGDLREIDPTKVRQSNQAGFARSLVSADGKLLSMGASSSFTPLSKDMAEMVLSQATAPADSNRNQDASANVVNDFPSQLLLLVK